MRLPLSFSCFASMLISPSSHNLFCFSSFFSHSCLYIPDTPPPLPPSLLSMQMMAWLQLWTMGLLAAMAISPAVTSVPGLLVVEEENPVPVRTARRETRPILSRQKRDWIWNSLYVEEEKPAPNAYKIGQVGLTKISHRVWIAQCVSSFERGCQIKNIHLTQFKFPAEIK